MGGDLAGGSVDQAEEETDAAEVDVQGGRAETEMGVAVGDE